MIRSIQYLLTLCLVLNIFSCLDLKAEEDEDLILTFTEHKGPVYSLAVHPDGKTVATAAEALFTNVKTTRQKL